MKDVSVDRICTLAERESGAYGLMDAGLRKRLTTQCGVYDAVRANEESGHFRVEVRMPAVTTA